MGITPVTTGNMTAIKPPIIRFSSYTDRQIEEILHKMLSERHRFLDSRKLAQLLNPEYRSRYRLSKDPASATRPERERLIAHLAMLGVPVPFYSWFHCVYYRHPEPRREADVCALDEKRAIEKAQDTFGGLWDTYITAHTIG